MPHNPSLKQTMHTDVVILGGGIAGLQSALELSRMGLQSVVAEKAPFLGGHVASLSCKATDRCQRCGACTLEDVMQQVSFCATATTHVRTEARRVERTGDRFRISLSRRPPTIFPKACSDCGQCESVCPVPGALLRSPMDNSLYIAEDRCLFFLDRSCRACSEVCPDLAVSLGGQAEELEITSSAIIVAAGYRPYDATEKPCFGYGIVPGVITSLELDSLLRKETWSLEPHGEEQPSVAFIQCVGSRDAKIGRSYCSRVCCANALRVARLLKTRAPGIRITLFYMDLQNVDRDFEKRLKEAEQEVTLIRSMPAEIRTGADGRPQIVYHGPDDKRINEAVDLVVLSIGMSPQALDGLLDLSTQGDGFLGNDGEKVITNIDGVFLAGTAQGPKSIEETVSHAIRAAGEAASYIRKGPGGGPQ